MATVGFIRVINRKSYAAIHAQMSQHSVRAASDAGKVKVAKSAGNSIESENLQPSDLIFKEAETSTKNRPQSSNIDDKINDEVLTNFYIENDGKLQGHVDIDHTLTGLIAQEKMSAESDHSKMNQTTTSKILNQLHQANADQAENSGKILDVKVRDIGEAMVVKCVKASKKISDGNLLKKFTDKGSEIKKKLPDWQKRVANNLTSFQDYVTKRLDKKKEK